MRILKPVCSLLLLFVLALARPAFALFAGGGSSNVCSSSNSCPANSFLSFVNGVNQCIIPQLAGDCTGPINNTTVGTIHLNASVQTSNYQMTNSDVIVAADATAGPITITLTPSLGGTTTPDIFVMKLDSSTNAVTVAVFAGDTLNGSTNSIVLNGAGTALKAFPIQPQIWLGQAQGTTTGGMLAFSSSGTSLSTGNNISTYVGFGSAGTVEANQQTPVSRAGVLSQLSCYDNVAPGASNTQTITVRACTQTNGICTGSSTTVTCAVTGAAGTTASQNCQDLTHPLVLASNQYIDLQATCTTGTTCAAAELLRCSFSFTPF